MPLLPTRKRVAVTVSTQQALRLKKMPPPVCIHLQWQVRTVHLQRQAALPADFLGFPVQVMKDVTAIAVALLPFPLFHPVRGFPPPPLRQKQAFCCQVTTPTLAMALS